jgi:hypothetical protein
VSKRFSSVDSSAISTDYYYLELLSRDCPLASEIEQLLISRTSDVEYCYTQSRIPVYRIPITSAEHFDPWPFIEGQSVYTGRVLRIGPPENRGFLFRNALSLPYVLDGEFQPLSGKHNGQKAKSGASKDKKRRQRVKNGG